VITHRKKSPHKFKLTHVGPCLCFAVILFWTTLATLSIISPDLLNIDVNLPKTRIAPALDWRNPAGWMGYDAVGSSLLFQLAHGAGVSVVVGLATALGSLAIGVPLGALAGYAGGWSDLIITRAMDILLAFPPLVLPLLVAAFFGGGLATIVLALCIGGWIGSAKIIRSQLRTLKSADYVSAARALGASPARLMIAHLLPNTLAPVIVHATFSMAGAILAESGLSFLGLGLGDGHVSWGGLLNDGRAYLIESPHMIVFPSLAIFSLVFSLNYLGERLRIALDPRQVSARSNG